MSKEAYEFISKTNNDPIVEWRNCAISGQPFAIFQSETNFFGKIMPTFAGKKFTIPLPTLCPEERQRKRILLRNERTLYKRKCDATGENIISVYAPNGITNSSGVTQDYKVYDHEFRWSDKRDSLQYGKDFDFSKTFSQQFAELNEAVPHLYLVNTEIENSYYTNFVSRQKNCYLIFGGADDEDCSYGVFLINSNNCMDTHSCNGCEFCYECIDCIGCYHCIFSTNCSDCGNCIMSEDCVGCKNCIACFGLANSEYCFLNKKYSKEDFAKIEEEYRQLTLPKIHSLKEKFTELKNGLPHKHAYIYKSENCLGNVITEGKMCTVAFDARGSEDCTYIYSCPNSKRSQDCTFNALEGVENCYNVSSTVAIETGAVTFMTRYGSNMFYCMECFYCNDCFGCAGLKQKQYCIFNKQYEKEAYEIMVAKIIEHMIQTKERGEYLDPSITPYGYNETTAQEYFPLTRDEALARGYKWQDKNYDPIIPAGTEVLEGDQIPDDSSQVNDDILQRIFICEVSGRPYRITPQELAFYRKLHLPLPRKHHDIRHLERFRQRPQRSLHLRNCDKCDAEMLSIHAKDTTFKVYCEACYNKAVY